jgi:hypothetical protein
LMKIESLPIENSLTQPSSTDDAEIISTHRPLY